MELNCLNKTVRTENELPLNITLDILLSNRIFITENIIDKIV